MNLLHIIDDEKFIKFCKQTFDLDFVNNHYLNSGEISLFYLEEHKIDIIFIHYLRIKEVDFFYKNKVEIPKMWMNWGADGFSLPFFYNQFLDKESKSEFNRIKLKTGISEFIKHRIKLSFNKKWNQSSLPKKTLSVINQMDYIIPIVPGDYDLLKAKYNILPKCYHFNYVTDLFGNLNESGEGNILLGNSASVSNNHFSILKLLNKVGINDRKVYVPLSYGNKSYKNYILDYISKLNNKNIIPLCDFMPYGEYAEIINSCEIMVMNHHRQQALGNIILGMLNGNTIYMNEKSSLYEYLVSNGFVVKNVNDLSSFSILNLKEKSHNAELTKQIFGKERQIDAVKKLLNVYR